MSSINLSIKNDLQAFLEQQKNEENSETKNVSGRIFLEKKLANILEMINYAETKRKLSNLLTNSNKQMAVLFRCSKCRFETIDLCLLRLHKQEHYSKFN
jgi:chromatin segregation and condensation protein Rec8/ScpA/Scc1 (kleisin family)